MKFRKTINKTKIGVHTKSYLMSKVTTSQPTYMGQTLTLPSNLFNNVVLSLFHTDRSG